MFQWFSKLFAGPPRDKASELDTKAPRGATLTSYLSPITGGYGTPNWTELDARRLFTEIVYSATSVIAQRVASTSLKAGTVRRSQSRTPIGPTGSKRAAMLPPWLPDGSITVLGSHPLLDAFHMPNAYLSGYDLLSLLVSGLQTAGESYVWYDEENSGPANVWYLPASWVRQDPDEPVPYSKFIIQPSHSAEEFRLDSSELIRFANPHPADPFDVTSPLRAAIQSVVLDKQIQESQLATFRNGVLGGTVFTVGQKPEASGIGDPLGDRPALTQNQRKVLTDLIRQAYSGAVNSGMPIILDAVIQDVKQLTGPSEIMYQESALAVRDRVLMAFKVNPIILGWTENANRAVASTADESFCEVTCQPISPLISDTLTRWGRARFEDPDLCLWLPVPQPRDADGRRANLDMLARYGSITHNELRESLGMDRVEWGEERVKAQPSVPPKPDTSVKPTEDAPKPDDAKRSEPWNTLTRAEKLAAYHGHVASRNGMKR